MSKPEPLGGKIITKPFMVLSVFAGIALVILVGRFFFGLGAVTNMNNGYPMGLWIVFDLVIGTAFACGGYALALVVYIVNKGEYHSLVRPALLTSVFGYSLGGIAVIIDLGRYWQAYTIFLPWHANLNSVMLELALCVALYTTVLWIEFSPSLFEKLQSKTGLRVINKVLFIFIALGVLLPTMHQSSMGSMLIALGTKLSPLWQTDLLPLLFLLSALSTGFSIVIFEASLSSLGFWRPLETSLLTKLAGIIRWVLAAYIIIRFADIIGRGQLGTALAGDLQGNMFLLDMALFIIPLVLLSSEKYRADPQLLFIAAVSMLLAGMLYRFNAFLVGYIPPDGYTYFPSLTEILVSVGMVSMEIMAFLFFVKKLPVLSRVERHT
ncbi:MAG: Ni/Fe-hydrogenase cytochrome b subunit [Candidatus Competibacteraceae bacterium]|jgi:Ni/Fe-hydrogenase subunit HybB-like protein|nr:Ni/Fe-hydrogenase cytochrome b subunit [Candidatus Competibacteraceae bacterium]